MTNSFAGWSRKIKNVGFLFAISTAFTGCMSQKKGAHTEFLGVGSDFQTHFESFERNFIDLTNASGISDLVIQYEEASNPLSADMTALCSYTEGETPTIYVNQDIYQGFDNVLHGEYAQENVIWHEMGHCVRRMMHLSTISGGRPVSLMYPSRINTNTYFTNHASYITTFFPASSASMYSYF